METCQVSVLLANIATVYILASLYYLIVTNDFGTPFKDAVKKHPELLKIKINSVSKRKKAFVFGVLFSIIGVCVFRPFSSCSN